MANDISITIRAQDQATQALAKVGRQIDDTSKAAEAGTGAVQRAGMQWSNYAALSASAGIATHSLVGMLNSGKEASFRLEAALTGLNSVARAFGQDADAAKKAARSLAKDGLMSVSDAATGLKNLLAAGFSLDQAVTLMNRFRDSAAFGRQSALSFGDAIRGATEGVKNGNSILVDNAGVTKNLSMMLEEAGYSAQDLMRASEDGGVRQAIYNGILAETNAQLGDAGRLSDSAAGAEARLSAQTETTAAKFGQALQPALSAFYGTMTPIVEKLGKWIEQNPQIASTMFLITTGVIGLVAVLGTLGFAISALGPLWTAMAVTATGSVSIIRGAWIGLTALIASPIAVPALAIGAALASIAAMLNAYRNAKNEIDRTNQEIQRNNSSQEQAMKDVIAQYKAGKISKENYQRFFNTIAGRATGGPVSAGQPYIVGEREPELFVPNQSGRILNQRQMAAEGIGGGGNTSITISGTINIATPEAAGAFWDRIDKTQRLAKMGMA